MQKKKVIILYSTGGMGHKKAAIALFKVFQDKAESVEVELIDVLEYGNRFYKFLYLDLYVFVMSHAKWLWAISYYFSDIPIVSMLTRKIRGYLDYNSLFGLGSMLCEKSPDAIVATHFLLPSIARILKVNKKLKSKLYTVITDYGPHSWWLSDKIDKFFVGSETVLQEMLRKNIAIEKIIAAGIPTVEEFHKDFNVDELCKKYGVDKERKTIFLMSGGFGVGPIAKMLVSLNLCRASIQVIAVCGHNKAAHDNIQVLKEKLNYPLVLFGFTDKIAELMSISDLMITKAGGISVTEAMNIRLPMILFASIPGQETWNEKLLVSGGAARKVKRVKDIPIITEEILLSSKTYDLLKAGIEKIRKPYAAESIVNMVLGEIDE